eukprot:m.48070 g.48070  ORF g.48070 m.48070 type:complete len:72 (+) comp10810_c0_seq13:2332-2547(+)
MYIPFPFPFSFKGMLCNAVLEIGIVDGSLTTLNIALRDSEERLQERMKELESSPLAVAAHHALRLRGTTEE